MEIHDFKKKQELISVFSVRTSTEDTTFQPKLAGCAPQLLTTSIFRGERPLSPTSISIQWDRETGQGQGTPGRGGQGPTMEGGLDLPSCSTLPLSMDSSGWQEGHKAQSLERLMKEQDTDKSY